MAHITPKLNLNKTPQSVDNNSLVFAKNIRLLSDGCLTGDCQIDETPIITINESLNEHIKGKLVGEVVGVNSKIYFFVYDSSTSTSSIYEYDETLEISEGNNPILLNTNWTYNGGEITGCVTINNTNESILTICEYNCPNNVLVPIKHINLAHPSVNDESLYTQSPEVPLANLSLIDYYTETIPNGVYQFFIRYKIAYEHYTNWFPCSRELYIASISETNTALGTLRHITPHTDSDKSFILGVDFVNEEAKSNYTHFQLGFIISHDNASNARIWKEFPIEYQSNIYFSYKEEDIKEISIEEITDITYDLYNVGNITSYRNKLYVSNYTETDFNRSGNVNAKILLNYETADFEDDFEGTIILNRTEGTDYAESVTVNGENYTINDIYINDEYTTKSIVLNYKNRTLYGYDPVSQHENIDKAINNNNYSIGIDYLLIYLKIHVINDNEREIIIEPNNQSNELETYIYNELNNVFQYDLPLLGLNYDKIYDTLIKYINKCFANYRTQQNDLMRFQINDNKIKIRRKYDDTNYDWIYVDNYKVEFTILLDYIVNLRNRQGHKKFYDYHKINVYTTLNNNSTTVLNLNPNILNTRTLLPFTKYDFYIHYVTEDGSILNGIYIGSKTLSAYSRKTYNVCQIGQQGTCKLISILSSENIDDYIRPIEENARLISTDILQSNEIIYPIFDISHAILPDIKGWFISCYKHHNNIAQGFNINTDIDNHYRIYCLESDILLYSLNNNITILNSNGEIITNKARYYSSNNDDINLKSLGNVGFIEFKNDNEVETISDVVWIQTNNIVDDNIKVNINLTKITPIYSITSNKSNKNELNLPGFLSFIKKPKIELGDEYFISNNDVFKKTDDNTLNEYKQNLNNSISSGYVIHSNFNLNLLNLTTSVQPIQRDYKIELNNQEVTKTQWFTPINSLTASTIYNHESTYYEFTKRTYIPVDTEKPHNIINYDNTVRSSNVDADESHRYIYKFYPNSYYNVPTNRGKIVKLFTILNNIYAHCEHGLFAFIDNKQLNTNNQSVALLDSDVFDIGVQEVLDSQYGYAGISNKEHSLVTKDSYIFYDSIVKTIYLYDGSNKIVPISESIKKVIEFTNPTNVLFVDDFHNNRFYINLKNNNDNVCLTYNFISKSFISIHDIDFDKAFNSRSTAYFVKKSTFELNTQYNVYKFNNKSIYDNNQREDIYYGNLYKKSLISVTDESIEDNIIPSTIDIICNNRYELINVLEYVNWISHLSREFHTGGAIEMGEENRENYCGDYIRVYSDQTYTPLLSIGNNDEGVLDPNSVLNGGYKKPSFNAGIWTFNYLRNIKPEDIPDTRISDKASLIYGKYFVVRFLFNNRFFKLENIIFNTNNYGKV